MEENENREEIIIPEERSISVRPEETDVLPLSPETPEPDLSNTTRQTDEYLAWLASLEN